MFSPPCLSTYPLWCIYVSSTVHSDLSSLLYLFSSSVYLDRSVLLYLQYVSSMRHVDLSRLLNLQYVSNCRCQPVWSAVSVHISNCRCLFRMLHISAYGFLYSVCTVDQSSLVCRRHFVYWVCRPVRSAVSAVCLLLYVDQSSLLPFQSAISMFPLLCL
jgi:hypothetical protein